MSAAFAAYIAKVAAEGETDCAIFQANAYRALTGNDLAAQWRGKYRSYREGLRLMRSLGYKDPKDYVKAIASPVNMCDVLTGDLCFLGNSGCVFSGNMVFGLDVGMRGLSVMQLDDRFEIYRVNQTCQP